MRSLTSLMIFYLFLSFSQMANAQSEVESVFQAANEAYLQKNYDQAIRLYQSIVDAEMESPELYFNLGNCFFQKKEWGKTILNYERALLINPNDASIQQNLQLAKQETIDEIAVLPTFFLTRWWIQIRELTHSGAWSILGILLFWLGIAGVIFWILGKERTQRKKGFLGGMASLVLSFIIFALAYSSYQIQDESKAAIIMSKETSLKSLPDEISNEILPLHEGTKVKITGKVTSWYKVRLDNGEVGWIIESALEEI